MAELNKTLFSACRTGKINVVKKYLDDGLDPNSLDKYSMTGLINAARKGRAGIAEVLYARGADLDIGDVRNRTALFHAVSFGHLTFVETILGFGADLSTVDTHGWTPLDMARHQKNAGIATLLEKAGAEGKDGESPTDAAGVESKSDRARNAMDEKISNRIGENHNVEYRCYVENDEGVIVDNLSQVAIDKLAVFIAEPNDCWDNDGQGSFQSPCLDRPTWLDLCVTLQEQISFSGDTSHIAFEGIIQSGTIPIDGKEIAAFQFILGS